MSFKLVSFYIFSYCFTAEDGGIRTPTIRYALSGRQICVGGELHSGLGEERGERGE